jgi:hypothetical protein
MVAGTKIPVQSPQYNLCSCELGLRAGVVRASLQKICLTVLQNRKRFFNGEEVRTKNGRSQNSQVA